MYNNQYIYHLPHMAFVPALTVEFPSWTMKQSLGLRGHYPQNLCVLKWIDTFNTKYVYQSNNSDTRAKSMNCNKIFLYIYCVKYFAHCMYGSDTPTMLHWSCACRMVNRTYPVIQKSGVQTRPGGWYHVIPSSGLLKGKLNSKWLHHCRWKAQETRALKKTIGWTKTWIICTHISYGWSAQ